jgi:hypothetical protein
MPIQNQKELNEAKARINKLWEAESKIVFKHMAAVRRIEEETDRFIDEMAQVTAVEVDNIRKERDPLEREAFGNLREVIMKETGIDPLTGKTMQQLMAEAMKRMVEGLSKPPTKTPPTAEKPFNTPFGDPSVDFDKLGL